MMFSNRYSNDIYFSKEYCDLNAKLENGESVHYQFSSQNGLIVHNFIKRKIPNYEEEQYYDIRTPYGYGGPLIVHYSNKEKLLKEYEIEFSNYCKDNNIISEFVRFHPLACNAVDFNSIYKIEKNRKVIVTNLKSKEESLNNEINKKCLKKINKIIDNGLKYRVIENPKKLDTFIEIYYETMNKNSADDYYYFERDYFVFLLNKFSNQLVEVQVSYNDIVIADSISFKSSNILYIHLSGTRQDYYKMSPSYLLRYGLIEWGINNGIDYIYHGGGKTTSMDDKLLEFKKQFGINYDCDFYIAEKEWNALECSKLRTLLKENETINDFINRKGV